MELLYNNNTPFHLSFRWASEAPSAVTWTVEGDSTEYKVDSTSSQFKVLSDSKTPTATACFLVWQRPSFIFVFLIPDNSPLKSQMLNLSLQKCILQVAYNAASFDSATGTVSSTLVNNNPQADKHYTCNVNYAARTFHGVTTLSVFGELRYSKFNTHCLFLIKKQGFLTKTPQCTNSVTIVPCSCWRTSSSPFLPSYTHSG